MDGFGPSFLGLTGPPTAVQQAASAFKVAVERIQFSADPGDYAMTHVSPIFVMRPNDPSHRRWPLRVPGNHRGRAEEGSRLRTTLAIGRRRVGP